MQIKKGIQPTRIYLLIRNTLVLKRLSILVICSAVAGLVTCLSLMDASGSLEPQFHRNMYLFILFAGGIWLTSRTYRAFHDPVDGLSWLLLPASSLEKTLSTILLSNLVYIACSLMVYFPLSFVSEGLNRLVLDRFHPVFNPFDPSVIRGISLYFAAQAPFLIGAVYFKKHVLSKTILSMFLLLLFLGTAGAVSVWVILGNMLSGPGIQSVFEAILYSDVAGVNPVLFRSIKLFTLVGIPIVSWTICYFRHTETER